MRLSFDRCVLLDMPSRFCFDNHILQYDLTLKLTLTLNLSLDIFLHCYLVSEQNLPTKNIHYLVSWQICHSTCILSYSLIPSNHHHHIALVARISLTLSRHSSLSFIALGRSSGQHPVSSHSCWMYVRAGRPAFARPCVGIHKSTSLMSSSLLLQQCPACLVRLTWIVFGIGGRWPYSWCLVGCCCQDFPLWKPIQSFTNILYFIL